MARVSTYLNFVRETEKAFIFYRSIFGGDFIGGISRFSEMPVPSDGTHTISDEDKNLVMHIELQILGDHILMGTDAPESMGFKVMSGNNMYINLEPDTRIETERLFNSLSESGSIETKLQDMFWGAYFGSCKDKFGIQWMFNCMSKN